MYFRLVFNPEDMKIGSKNQLLFFKNETVLRFEAVGFHTIIHSIDGKRQKVDESIDNIEMQLKDSDFIRIHSLHIVNVNYITQIYYGPDDFVELNNHKTLPINEIQKTNLIEFLSNHLNKR